MARLKSLRSLSIAGGIWLLAVPAAVFAAETADPIAMRTTMIVLQVDADAPLVVRTSFQPAPPMLTIEFPSQRVMSSLPQRSAVGSGVIRSIAARYEDGPSQQGKRFLSSLQIALGASYAYHVRSEPGRVIVEILHPAAVGGASAMEVGLRGGTIIGGLGNGTVTERFRAMQKALAFATPTPLTLQINTDRGELAADEAGGARATPRTGTLTLSPSIEELGAGKPQGAAGSPAAKLRPMAIVAMPARGHSTSRPAGLQITLLLGLLGLSALSLWQLSGWFGEIRASRRPSTLRAASGRLPSGVVLVDQLVWRAFERQGYQLVTEMERMQPPLGTFRVIMKDGAKAALLFVGHGPLFEKQTVERFLRAMHEANATQGFLVAAGSFTVPAQRIAKDHQIVLIEREQLTELLSAGAGSEYFAKQLEHNRVRLEASQETLRQYASELDTLRRQRNEASWYLGEERAKSAKLDAQLAELGQQVSRCEATITQWEQGAAALRKQWEESQWYLGESQNRVRFLESQLTAAQEAAGQERAAHATLDAQIAGLQQQLQEFKQELQALHTYGERRRWARAVIPEASVELVEQDDGSVLSVSPRDISSRGVGLEFDRAITEDVSMRVRLRFPGREPIESKAELKWQRSEGEPARFQSGCRLIGLSASTRALIQQLVGEAQSSRV